MATTINYLSLTGLQRYDVAIKEFIANKVAEGDAKSFKFVNLEDGVLKFYTVNPITEDTVADFEIELPEQDLSHLMQLVDGAVNGNIATFGENGQVIDSGIALTDLATKEEVEGVQANIDTLSAYVGTIPEDAESTNIVAYVNEKAREVLESATGGSSESAASVKLALDEYKALNDPKVQANTNAIAEIEKDYLTSVDKQELQDQIDANESAIELLTNGVDSETIDGVNDLIAYVNEHGTEVTTMQENIANNATAIANEKTAREEADATLAGRLDTLEAINHDAYIEADTTLKTELEGKINAKADSSVVTALDERVVAVEGKAHEHTNKEVIDGITAEKVAAWDASEANAKAYVDEKIEGVDLSGIATNAAAIEALSKTHTDDKSELVAADEAMAADIAALKEVEHVAITDEQIDELFA